MDLKTEKPLVERARTDKEAFSELYDYYYSKIYKYSLRRTGNAQTALDITSIVFIKALKNIKKFEWRDFPFSSWLYKIATNEIHNFLKDKHHRVISLDMLFEKYEFEPTAIVDIEKELIEAEEELQKNTDFLKTQKMLLTLESPYQEVISLRFFENKKIKEISQILERSEGTIKSQLSRGIAKLKNKLTSQKSQSEEITSIVQPFKKFPVISIEAKG